MKNEILLVGGDFNETGGRPSTLINKIYTTLKNEGMITTCFNGGNFQQLKEIFDSIGSRNYIVLWFPNVPNEFEKVRSIKEKYPHTLLVTSKRNNGEYSYSWLINRMLESKTNLLVEFSKENDDSKLVKGTILDPLGNVWGSGTNFDDLTKCLIKRLEFLASMTRQSSVWAEGKFEVPNNEDFFEVIRSYAETFHSLINPEKDVERFLGNASFRCERGFPSFKTEDNIIFMSRRNVDKRYIDKENFVAVKYIADNNNPGMIYYYGENKPSVDTPIQVRLYDLLPTVRYMLHSHCYIKGAPFTEHNVPCGAIEEVREIQNAISLNSENSGNYFLNLIGHGSIAMVADVQHLKDIDYIGRPLPEDMSARVTTDDMEKTKM